MTTAPNTIYHHRGYYFRVDFVEDGEVYLRRATNETDAERMRVTVETWEEQMAGATLVEEHGI